MILGQVFTGVHRQRKIFFILKKWKLEVIASLEKMKLLKLLFNKWDDENKMVDELHDHIHEPQH